MEERYTRWLTLAALLMLGGCATLDRPVSREGTLAECEVLFIQVDAAVDAAGVRDEGAARVTGFPWLRSTRLLASFRDEVADEARFAAWLAQLAAEDATARRYELQNLAVPVAGYDAETLNGVLDQCREQLIAADRADPTQRQRLREAVTVADDYVTVWRAAGLYPVTAPFVSMGVRRWHRDAHATFALPPAALPVTGTLRRWEARARGEPLAPEAIVALMAGSRDALGIPRPGEAELEQLFTTFAPRFEVDVVDENDLPGALYWGKDGPRVDTGRPTLYWLPSHTRLGDTVLLQLNYLIWFPARPGDDIYAGRLDGIHWRVTLDRDGEPLLYDAIHPCGCYHMFFPTERLRVRGDLPRFYYEPPLVPQPAPVAQPLTVRLSSGEHYIERVYHAPDHAAARPLAWAPYDTLRALPVAGATRSLFGRHGLVAGTERPERFLLWPMGVRSPGAMRQWGRHPTAFVGRRHFDAPDLIPSIFERVAP